MGVTICFTSQLPIHLNEVTMRDGYLHLSYVLLATRMMVLVWWWITWILLNCFFFFFFYCPFWLVIKCLSFLTCNQILSQVSPCGWWLPPTHLHHKIEKQNHVRRQLRKEKQGERPRDEWIIYCKGRMSVISAVSWKGSISPKKIKFKKIDRKLNKFNC
jgi:hypothetical protein